MIGYCITAPSSPSTAPLRRLRSLAIRFFCALLFFALPAACATTNAPVNPDRPDHPAAVSDARGKNYVEAQRRATTFLLSIQRPSGRFGASLPERPYDIFLDVPISLDAFGAATSALACMGLRIQPSQPDLDAALKRGYRWLLETKRAKRVSGNTFYNTWTHIYLIEALCDAITDDRFREMHGEMRARIATEVKALERIQSLDGGFGYFDFGAQMDPPSGMDSSSFVTAAALLAFKSASRIGVTPNAARVARGLRHLNYCRFGTGAYAYGSGHYFYPIRDSSNVKGSLGRSQACNRALRAWENTAIDTADVRKGLDNLFELHHFIENGRQRELPHEAYYSNAGYYFYFGHWYASQNLADIDEHERATYAKRLGELVATTQSPDGSFWDFPLYDFGKAYGTGFALLTLERCRRAAMGE